MLTRKGVLTRKGRVDEKRRVDETMTSSSQVPTLQFPQNRALSCDYECLGLITTKMGKALVVQAWGKVLYNVK